MTLWNLSGGTRSKPRRLKDSRFAVGATLVLVLFGAVAAGVNLDYVVKSYNELLARKGMADWLKADSIKYNPKDGEYTLHLTADPEKILLFWEEAGNPKGLAGNFLLRKIRKIKDTLFEGFHDVLGMPRDELRIGVTGPGPGHMSIRLFGNKVVVGGAWSSDASFGLSEHARKAIEKRLGLDKLTAKRLNREIQAVLLAYFAKRGVNKEDVIKKSNGNQFLVFKIKNMQSVIWPEKGHKESLDLLLMLEDRDHGSIYGEFSYDGHHGIRSDDERDMEMDPKYHKKLTSWFTLGLKPGIVAMLEEGGY